MSTPKLKVYRLPENYNAASNPDVQSIVNDELVPIVQKDLNVFNMEELVPVRERRDARLVKEKVDANGSPWHTIIVPFEININNLTQVKTAPICCDGWVLGQGNIELSVFKITSAAVTYQTSQSPTFDLHEYMVGCSENFSREQEFTSAMEGMFGTWSPAIDLKYWRYDVETKKVMTNGLGQITPIASEAIRYNQSDYIVFSIGELIQRDNKMPGLTPSATSNYLPLIGSLPGQYTGYAMVRYKLYEELAFDGNQRLFAEDSAHGSIITQNSIYRVPFGDIYNGNRSGRDIRLTNAGVVDNEKISHYEGNYVHKRRILPLRALVGQKSGISSSFSADVVYDGGTVNFEAGSDWYFDGAMKPAICEKIRVYDYNCTSSTTQYPEELAGSYNMVSGPANYSIVFNEQGYSRGDNLLGEVFKQLDEDVQINALRPEPTAEGTMYRVSFKDAYYRQTSSSYLYPEQVFLFYNCHDDAFGLIGDFNYNYSEYESFPKYGHENNGKFVASDARFFNTDGIVYKKKDALAVCDDGVSGYQAETTWLLVKDEANHQVSFSIPQTWKGQEIEIDFGIKIYSQTTPILDTYLDTHDACISNYSITNRDVVLTYDSEATLPTELMVVYFESHQIGFSKDSENHNPWCMGYRIPCYEKARSSKRWVSSFPNWASEHLNNDLDVFYGNAEYSGTNTATQSNNGIYPCYLEPGTWQAFYNDGYIEFNEEKESVDYFDIFNFPTLISSSISLSNILAPSVPNYLPTSSEADAQKLSLYYAKAKANVAHYDGIFAAHRCRLSNYSVKGGKNWYAPLEDEDFAEVLGKKWISQETRDIKVVYENNQSIYPKINTVTETLSAVKTYVSNAHELWRVSTNTDRIEILRYQINIADRNDLVLLINPSDTSGETKAVSGSDVNENDVRIHVNIKDHEGENCFCVGTESSNVDKTQIFVVPIDWNYYPDFENLYNSEVSISNVHLQAPRFKYEDADWYYDVYVELISYRYAAYSSTTKNVSMVEFAVYKVDKPR